MRAIALVFSAVLVMTACGREPTPIEPTATAAAPSSPTGTSKPKPPTLPAAAKRNDETGAANFVAHWVRTSDYAAVTGDTAPLREISDPQCTGCARYIQLYARTYASGGSFSGGEHQLRDVSTLASDSGIYVSATVEAAPGHFSLKAGGPSNPSKAETTRLTYLAVFEASRWIMSDIGLSEP